MRSYEAMFILKSDLATEDLEKTIGKIKEIIEKNNGVIDQASDWGKQKLAYPIKKQSEGVYYLVNLHMSPDAVSSIKRAFSLNESILRVLITLT